MVHMKTTYLIVFYARNKSCGYCYGVLYSIQFGFQTLEKRDLDQFYIPSLELWTLEQNLANASNAHGSPV
eukprot:snap_masked-scaffold_22-processed-gene-3.37-mRNA-1 protein AED:1.00 eAED:1.00 QI:0/0/0/0/1/1/2/0/69